jgi:hypothetical protein
MARRYYSSRVKNSGSEIVIKTVWTDKQLEYEYPVLSTPGSVLSKFPPHTVTPNRKIIEAYHQEDLILRIWLLQANAGEQILAAFRAHPFAYRRTVLSSLLQDEREPLIEKLHQWILSVTDQSEVEDVSNLPEVLKQQVWSKLPIAEKRRLANVVHRRQKPVLVEAADLSEGGQAQ